LLRDRELIAKYPPLANREMQRNTVPPPPVGLGGHHASNTNTRLGDDHHVFDRSVETMRYKKHLHA